MKRGIDARARRIAAAMLACAVSVVTGTGIAAWAVDDTNAFYMKPIDHYGTPAYARRQPVADSFWQAQDGADAPARYQATVGSTATSAQPEYRSASGS